MLAFGVIEHYSLCGCKLYILKKRGKAYVYHELGQR